jgi:hypothetical protein
MIVWICSFDLEATRPALCPAVSVQWPLFCTRLADIGLVEMQNQMRLSSKSVQSRHFIHGMMEIKEGLPYKGPLTKWHEATFAQHEFFGKARDAYSIQAIACHWFNSPVQVFTRLAHAGESHIQVRASSMAFYPSAVEKLLAQSLEVAPETHLMQNATSLEVAPKTHVIQNATEAKHFIADGLVKQLGVIPFEIPAIQVMAPLIPFLKQNRLSELVWFSTWPSVIPGFPHFLAEASVSNDSAT